MNLKFGLNQKPYDQVTQSLIKKHGISKKVLRLIKVYCNKKERNFSMVSINLIGCDHHSK